MAIEKWGLVWFPRTVASVTPYTSTAHERHVHIPDGTLVRAENCIANGGGHFEQVLSFILLLHSIYHTDMEQVSNIMQCIKHIVITYINNHED